MRRRLFSAKAQLVALLGLSITGALLTTVIGGLSVAQSLASQTRILTVPLDSRLPALDANGSATIVGGAYASARVAVNDLGTAASTMLVLGDVLYFATIVVVGVALALYAWRMVQKKPPIGEAIRLFTTMGITVLAGSAASQLLTGLGTLRALDEIASAGLQAPPAPLELLTNVPVAWLGIVLLIVAGVLAHSRRLARELEGLV